MSLTICGIGEHNFELEHTEQRHIGVMTGKNQTCLIVSFVCVDCGMNIEMRGSNYLYERGD